MSRRFSIPQPMDFGTVGGWWPISGRTSTLISSKFSVLVDYSGNGRDMSQGTSGKRPTKVDNVLNGRSVARFVAASSTYLQTAAFTGIAHPIVWWVVAKLTSQSGVPVLISGTDAESLYAGTGTTLNFGGASQFSATQSLTSAFVSIVGISNGASSSLRVNGAQVATGTLTAGNLTQVALGALYDGSALFADGDIADSGFFVGLPPSIPDFESYYLRTEFHTW